jgi:hypothetical protein
MKNKKWVICSVCGRKYVCEDDGKPKKHYVAPKRIILGEMQYLVNPSWEGKQRPVCEGSYEKGELT